MDHHFQVVDILSDDLYNPEKKTQEFVITLYGINQDSERLVCHVKKYKPYFFIKIPNTWDNTFAKTLMREILKYAEKTSTKRFYTPPLFSVTIKNYKDFYGLYWNDDGNDGDGDVQRFQYLKISCPTHGDMKSIIQATKDYYGYHQGALDEVSTTIRDWFLIETTANCDSNLYESSLPPVVRFIHDTQIDPTGWVSVKEASGKNVLKSGLFDACTEITTIVADVKKYNTTDTSSYVIASFDIECDSAHGDFPQAYKDFKKLATGVYDSYRLIYKKLPPMAKQDFKESPEEYIEPLVLLGFKMIDENDLSSVFKHADIHEIFIQGDKKPTRDSVHSLCYSISHLEFHLDEVKLPNKVRDEAILKMKHWFKDMLRDKDKKPLQVRGDPVIQIGTVFYTMGKPDDDPDKIVRHIAVIGPQDNMEDSDICESLDDYNIIVEPCKTEKDLLIAWTKMMNKMDPDFVTGYNIFGFDFRYMRDRASAVFQCPRYTQGKNIGKVRCDSWRGQCTHHDSCPIHEFYNLGKMTSNKSPHKTKRCKAVNKQLNSSALGENSLDYITMDGRIIFDIQKEVQKGHSLESYKLDNVASHFMRGKLKDIQECVLMTDSTGHLKDGDFVSFRTHSNIGELLHESGKKYKIQSIVGKQITLDESLSLTLTDFHKIEWCLNKDDISPQDIFDYHKLSPAQGGAQKRAEVAKYCIQDCELCINLALLLDIIPNNLAMANVSYVPASYIFLRGQGIKVTSVVTRMCGQEQTRIPDLKKLPLMKDYVKMVKNKETREKVLEQMIDDAGWRKPRSYELDEWYQEAIEIASGDKGMMGYEGAIVLDPKPGIYLDDPIAVMDYASLYPSSIIEKNLSQETQIVDEELLESLDPDDYHTIEYENWVYRLKGKGDAVEKVKDENEPIKTCYFLKPEFMQRHDMGDKGIIPKVLEHLLEARKDTKKRMKAEKDDFKYKVLDGLQLAYKVTANSVYGQLGARTSTIFKMNIAACTTAIGRERIGDAERGVKRWALSENIVEPDVVYGDTDSIFVKFSREKDGRILEGKEALGWCIECGEKAGAYITEMIHQEQGHTKQVLEYEKTFWPFILISKKRYTGDKYEFDTESCKRNAMGIVLKRRDNAPIVKHVFGNVIEIIMMDRDFEKAKQWLIDTLKDIKDGQYDISHFVITKALAGYYKNPQQIAHKVLADRMAERDPGNKPRANDRIPYAYIKLSDHLLYDSDNPYKSGKRKGQKRARNVMQGDRIEHLDYIQDNQIDLDYNFYITNQIMNPVKQVLDLVMDPTETEALFRG